MVATPVPADIHRPPGTALKRVVVAPVHTVDTPVMLPGVVLTVTVFTDLQPEESV